jgi:hypothetical protein
MILSWKLLLYYFSIIFWYQNQIDKGFKKFLIRKFEINERKINLNEIEIKYTTPESLKTKQKSNKK